MEQKKYVLKEHPVDQTIHDIETPHIQTSHADKLIFMRMRDRNGKENGSDNHSIASQAKCAKPSRLFRGLLKITLKILDLMGFSTRVPSRCPDRPAELLIDPPVTSLVCI